MDTTSTISEFCASRDEVPDDARKGWRACAAGVQRRGRAVRVTLAPARNAQAAIIDAVPSLRCVRDADVSGRTVIDSRCKRESAAHVREDIACLPNTQSTGDLRMKLRSIVLP